MGRRADIGGAGVSRAVAIAGGTGAGIAKAVVIGPNVRIRSLWETTFGQGIGSTASN